MEHMTHEERLAHEEGTVVRSCRRNVAVREKVSSWDDDRTRQLPAPWERTRRLFGDSDKRQEALKGMPHLRMGISPKGMLLFLAHPAVGFLERGGSFEAFLRAQLVPDSGAKARPKGGAKGGAVERDIGAEEKESLLRGKGSGPAAGGLVAQYWDKFTETLKLSDSFGVLGRSPWVKENPTGCGRAEVAGRKHEAGRDPEVLDGESAAASEHRADTVSTRGWLDDLKGGLEKCDQCGLQNSTGYDLQKFVVAWLQRQVAEGREYAEKSVCEIIRTDDRFRSLRSEVGIADCFWSHMQQDEFIDLRAKRKCPTSQEGGSSDDADIRHSTLAFLYADKYDDADRKIADNLYWLDYFCIRQLKGDFTLPRIFAAIQRINAMVIDVGFGEDYYARSFCVFEAYAAVLGEANGQNMRWKTLCADTAEERAHFGELFDLCVMPPSLVAYLADEAARTGRLDTDSPEALAAGARYGAGGRGKARSVLLAEVEAELLFMIRQAADELEFANDGRPTEVAALLRRSFRIDAERAECRSGSSGTLSCLWVSILPTIWPEFIGGFQD
jgi:hypothetical protein